MLRSKTGKIYQRMSFDILPPSAFVINYQGTNLQKSQLKQSKKNKNALNRPL